MLLVYFSAVLYFTSSSYCANILAILPTPSYSHQISYRHLWKELSLRGHKVTLVTAEPMNDPKLTNLTEIDLKWGQLFSNMPKMPEEEMTPWNFHRLMVDISKGMSLPQMSSNSIQDLIKDRTTKFDIVLTEFIFPEYLALAEIHKCPKIIFATLDPTVIFHKALGNSINPVLYPDMGLSFHVASNFIERVISTLFTCRSLYYYYNKMFPDKDDIIREYFNLTTKTEDLVNDADLLFINVNPLIHNIRAIGPTTINIGDLRRNLPIVPLSKDLKEYLDSAKDGFIYFSLGTNIKSNELKKDSLNSIMQALGEMPYKILWKYEDDHLPGKSQNVKLVKWAPQPAVLAHTNIKLFVTQGGLQSMEEGIYAEVPFVVIPFVADQEQNSQIMKHKGIAVVVNRFPFIKKEDLKTAMLEVINNPSYRNAVKKLKQLAVDTPMTGLEKAVWWTEYVIRNKGAKHLRNPAADLPFYQYYLIDVIGFLVTVTAAILTLLFILLRKSIGLVRRIIDKPLAINKKVQ